MTTKVSLNSINVSGFGSFKEGMFSFLILRDGDRKGRVGGRGGKGASEIDQLSRRMVLGIFAWLDFHPEL